MPSNYPYDDDYYEDDIETKGAIRKFPRLVTRKFVHPISQPDKIDKYVNQAKVWIDAEGTEYKIKDMEKEYLFNILSWTENNKDRLNFTYNFKNYLRDDVPLVDRDAAFRDIRQTKLMKRVRKEYAQYLSE
jgi:hypothetical protein